jgi:sulfatase modifying factor 1
MKRFSLRQSWLVGVVTWAAGCASHPPLDPVTDSRLIRVPAGEYQIGAEGNQGNPPRRVTLSEFFIADAETTNREFGRFVAATGYRTDAERIGHGLVAREGMADWAWNEVAGAHWRRPFGPAGPGADDLLDHPVTQISGADAAAYCRWAGGRLPTLAEWEVAARAGARTRWPWGGEFEPRRANTWNGPDHRVNTRADGWLYTAPVRSFPPNAWGLHDVIGNVFEYCSDLPPGVASSSRSGIVAGRGGSWWCSFGTCDFFNLEDIGVMPLHGSLANQGFRIVFDRKESRPAVGKAADGECAPVNAWVSRRAVDVGQVPLP